MKRKTHPRSDASQVFSVFLLILLGVALYSLFSTSTVNTTYQRAASDSPMTERISVASDGTQANGPSEYQPSISPDGRYVAFSSHADNLVPADTNLKVDVFVHDRATGQTSRISVASDGTQADGDSTNQDISGDGRHVLFYSAAHNLPGGTAGLFLHDRSTNQLTKITTFAWDSRISQDGCFVVFGSYRSVGIDNTDAIFVYDIYSESTIEVSVASDGAQANDDSWSPDISRDGRYVAFVSKANNLVPGDTNGFFDIFVHDLDTGETTRVSVTSNNMQANGSSGSPSISRDGRYVAFLSDANNLVPGDTNGRGDVFVYDRQTGQTTRVSVASDGTQGNGYSRSPSISGEGRYAAFVSNANNLVPGDTNGKIDVFVHDRVTGETIRASVASDGIQGNDHSQVLNTDTPGISDEGRYVAFWSRASNLVPEDTNGFTDVFVRSLAFCLDFNNDNHVDVEDLETVVEAWHLTDSIYDLDYDGVVTVKDIEEVTSQLGECP